MKTITKQQLIEWNACVDGLKRFTGQTNNTDEPVEIINLIGGKNTTSDIIWLARKMKLSSQLYSLSLTLIKKLSLKFEFLIEIVRLIECGEYLKARNAAVAAVAAAYAADAVVVAYAAAQIDLNIHE